MFLNLTHQRFDAYFVARNLVQEVYKLAGQLPDYEKFALSSQIRRSSVSVLLNLSEGASKKSKADRKRFYEIARASLTEVDTALDICEDLNFLNGYDLEKLGELIPRSFQLLSALIKSNS
jgi:four helix bundle protein